MNVISNIKNYFLGDEKPPSPEGHSAKSLSSTDKKVSMIFSDHILSDVNKVDLPDSTVQKTDSMATPSLKNRMYSLVARAWNGLHEAVEYVFSQHIKSEDRIEGLPHYEYEIQDSDKSELEELKKTLKPELGAEVERLFFEEITSNGPNAFADMYHVLEEAGAKVSDFSKGELAELKVLYLQSKNSIVSKRNITFFNKVYDFILDKKIDKDDLLSEKEIEYFVKNSPLAHLDLKFSQEVSTELNELLSVLNVSKNKNSEFSFYIKKKISKKISFDVNKEIKNKIDEIEKDLEDYSDKKLKKEIEKTVLSLDYLSKYVSVFDSDNLITWRRLNEHFTRIIQVDSEEKTKIKETLGELITKNQDFVNDLVSTEFFVGGSDLSSVNQRLFMRSSEDLEKIKENNRKNAVKYLENNKFEKISIETIEEIHRINNENIIPSHYSKIREIYPLEDDVGTVQFWERSGVHPEDLKSEMLELLLRVNNMLKENRKKPISKFQWSLQVAKIHNDFLEIHPFWDRNGSTGLLLIELLMKEKGYQPPAGRTAFNEGKDYYKSLRRMFGNPLAVLIVLSVQIRIANIPGFYKSKNMQISKEKKEYYRRQLKNKEWFSYAKINIEYHPLFKKIKNIFDKSTD